VQQGEEEEEEIRAREVFQLMRWMRGGRCIETVLSYSEPCQGELGPVVGIARKVVRGGGMSEDQRRRGTASRAG
jgi:hypothetical protein